MTNPSHAIKVLITYSVIIPVAILIGYLLSDPLTYGTMGVVGFLGLLLLSPVFIKWHYPIMLMAITCPIACFFLPGNPPLAQVMVLLSFGIAIVERAMNSEQRFIPARAMVWPLVFTLIMAYMTARLTGGIGLKSLGGGGAEGGVGGGKKYIELFIGIAAFFALTSRGIPRERRKLYLAMYMLGGLPSFIGDLYPVLPGPLKYINLLIPPTSVAGNGLAARLGSFGITGSVIVNYMLARYGLRGIFLGARAFRMVFFLGSLYVSLMGGFRIALVTDVVIFTMFFFLEGLHRTRLLPIAILLLIIGAGLVIPFSRDLPHSIQRTLSFLPLDVDPDVKMDAEGSAQWRYDMWHDLWPKVPGYLLLGKGYALTAADYQFMGSGQFAYSHTLDKSSTGLAVAGDYHNGPLSTLIPFGVWGAIAIVWLLAAAVFVTYKNFKYSDPELQTANTYFFVISIWHIICFFFVFGAFTDDVFFIGRTIGFSIALNWGVRVLKPKVTATRPVFDRLKRASSPQPFRA
jgi:hypothetical protein